MQRSKEILIYLLFVVFSAFLWLVLVRTQKPSVSAQTGAEEQTEQTAQDPVTEKKLQVDVSLQDVPQGKSLRIFPSRVTVYLRVRLSDYETIDAESVRVWCSYPVRAKQSLPLHADVPDSRVLKVRIVPDEVEYIIEQE